MCISERPVLVSGPLPSFRARSGFISDPFLWIVPGVTVSDVGDIVGDPRLARFEHVASDCCARRSVTGPVKNNPDGLEPIKADCNDSTDDVQSDSKQEGEDEVGDNRQWKDLATGKIMRGQSHSAVSITTIHPVAVLCPQHSPNRNELPDICLFPFGILLSSRCVRAAETLTKTLT
jgi:hypothetical protein